MQKKFVQTVSAKKLIVVVFEFFYLALNNCFLPVKAFFDSTPRIFFVSNHILHPKSRFGNFRGVTPAPIDACTDPLRGCTSPWVQPTAIRCLLTALPECDCNCLDFLRSGRPRHKEICISLESVVVCLSAGLFICLPACSSSCLFTASWCYVFGCLVIDLVYDVCVLETDNWCLAFAFGDC